MSDYYLAKFWQDIKDPSWPNVSTWHDFADLDEKLKEECRDQHSLQRRLDEIENPRYWLPHTMSTMYKKDRFVFVNVLKCGSVHYSDFFGNRLGWQRFLPKSMEEFDGVIKFGLMMHPLDRYLKGLTEFAWNFDLDDDRLRKLATSGFMPDAHSISYSMQFDDLLDQIHWIPFQNMADKDVKFCMNNLFTYFDSPISVPTEHPALHISPLEKKLLHQKISYYWHNRSEPTSDNHHALQNLYHIYLAYAKDLKFYRLLLANFKPDWSHLKTHLA